MQAAHDPKTYGHLHEDDRVWFIADSFQWLDQDRGEPMTAQKAHVCYACRGAIPVGGAVPAAARRGRADQRKGPRGRQRTPA